MTYFLPSQSTTHQISDLLKPIKDLSAAWSIDLTLYIDDFYESFSTEMLDFRDAAALVLGASSVFARKVDFLYIQLQDALTQNLQKNAKNPSKSRRQSGLKSTQIDYTASPAEFDLTSFYDQFEVERCEDVQLIQRDPQTSLQSRISLETQNYKISPIFSSIQQQQTLVFEHWDDLQLRKALVGVDDAGPTLFSTPMHPDKARGIQAVQGEQGGIGGEIGEFGAVQGDFGQDEFEQNLSDQEDNQPDQQDNDDLDDLSFHAIEQVDSESLQSKIDDLWAKIDAFSREKPANSAQKDKPFQFMVKNQVFQPQLDVNYQNYTFVNEIASSDFRLENFDFSFVEYYNTTAFVCQNEFYTEKIHSSAVKKFIFSQPEQQQVVFENVVEQENQNSQVQVNFEFNVIANEDVQQVNNSVNPKQYKKIINKSYLSWKQQKFVCSAPFDVQKITQRIIQNASDNQNLRDLSANRIELAQNFMGMLLMANQGKCEIREDSNGIYIKKKLEE